MKAKRRSAGAEGHYLKWMLALIVIAILVALLVPGVSAGWDWRRNITIDNSGGGALTDYQVLVTLTDLNNMKVDGSDLRFTDTGNNQKYDYWIESWNVGGTSRIWVEVPSIADGESPKMYMWYGNSEASRESNGDATFQFFDGFPGSEIDTTNKWTIDGPGWSIVEGGGKLKGTNTTGRLTSKSTFSDGVILEIKSNYASAPENGYQIGGFFLSTGNAFGLLKQVDDAYYIYDSHWSKRYLHTELQNIELLTKISVKPTNLVDLSFTNYDDPDASYCSASDVENVVSGEPIALGKRYDNNPDYIGQDYNGYWDWIRVREYASTEPTTSVGDPGGTGGVNPVPELSTVILFSVGLIVLAGYVLLRRREKKKGE